MNIKTLISINIDLNLNHSLDVSFHWCIKLVMALRDLIFRTKRLQLPQGGSESLHIKQT